MITKEKVKKEIDRLSEVELEKGYLYLSSLNKEKKPKPDIRSEPLFPLAEQGKTKKGSK